MTTTFERFTVPEDHVPDQDVASLWDEICEQAQQVMSFPQWMIFTITPWEETDGISLLQAAHDGNLEVMTKIRDLLALEVLDFLASGGTVAV